VPMSVRQEDGGGKPASYFLLNVPGELYQRLQDRTGQLEIGFALTLFRSEGEHSIPALNGTARLPGLGNCRTRLNSSETSVRLGCVALENPSRCLVFRLMHLPGQLSNPPQFQCQGDYTPYFNQLLLSPLETRSF